MSRIVLAVVAVCLVSGCLGILGSESNPAVEDVTVLSEDPASVEVSLEGHPVVNGTEAQYAVLTDNQTETMDAVLLNNQTAVTLTADQPLTNSTRVAFQNKNGTRRHVSLPDQS